MALTQRVYSVLVVCSSDQFFSSLAPLLPETAFDPVKVVHSESAARQALDERDYDFVIINSPLPDDPAIRLATDLGASRSTAVLILLRNEVYPAVKEKVTPRGVFTLSIPTSRQALSTALDWMTSMRERLRTLEKKIPSMEEKMEEIRAANRAKWALIENSGMDEPTAHRYLEKYAMDHCISKLEAAKRIIAQQNDKRGEE